MKSENSFNNFEWKTNQKGKFYLSARPEKPSELPADEEAFPIDLNFQQFNRLADGNVGLSNGHEIKTDLGELIVDRIEGEVVYAKLKEGEGEEMIIPFDTITYKKTLNFAIVGKNKVKTLTQSFNWNLSLNTISNLLAEIIQVPASLMKFTANDEEVCMTLAIKNLTVGETDVIYVTFANSIEKTNKFQRSTNKDYSLYDAKNLVTFSVDYPLIISGLGFFRHTDNISCDYEFFLYEEVAKDERQLIYCIPKLTVKHNEVDSYYVLRYSIPPIAIQPYKRYYAVINFLSKDMRTYYCSSCSADIQCEGVNFRFYEDKPGEFSSYRTSNSSGHFPYVDFKFASSYLD